MDVGMDWCSSGGDPIKSEEQPTFVGPSMPNLIDDPLDLFSELVNDGMEGPAAPAAVPSVTDKPGPSGIAIQPLMSGPPGPSAPAPEAKPKAKSKTFACTACPRAFGEKKRLRIHWECAHAPSHLGFECPHSGCPRTFHKDSRSSLRIHLKKGHDYTPDQINLILPSLSVKVVTGAQSDGRASQVAAPAALCPPKVPQSSTNPKSSRAQKKRKAPESSPIPPQAQLAIGQDVLASMLQSQKEERASWSSTEEMLTQRIQQLETEVARLRARVPTSFRTRVARGKPRAPRK